TERTSAPRWLVFVSIYDCPCTPITFVDIDDIIQVLSARTVDTLLLPIFEVDSPASFSPSETSRNVAVLFDHGSQGFFSRYNQALIRTTEPAGISALTDFSSALKGCHQVHRIYPKPGDVVVLDNWKALHMRAAYKPRWDGSDRWLLRTYAAQAHS